MTSSKPNGEKPDTTPTPGLRSPHASGYSYFAFDLFFGEAKCEPSFSLIHVAGDVTCPNCTEPPRLCQATGCTGLVHTAEAYDGDETGVSSWTETRCDMCGNIGPLRGLTAEGFAEIRERDRRKQALRDEEVRREQALRDEEVRRRNHPTTSEKFEDWLALVNEMRQRGGIPGLMPFSSPPKLKQFMWSAGQYLQSFFFDDARLEFFTLVEGKLKGLPDDTILRGSGISFYWCLSRHYPRYEISGWRVNDDTGEFEEAPEWETDDSEEWESRRREFRAYLCRLVGLLDVDTCVEWSRTLWEVNNACAASEWHLARRLFAHARQENQCPPEQLIMVQANFEHRVVFGSEIDSKLGMGPDKTVHPKWRDLREAVPCFPVSAEALYMLQDLMEGTSIPNKLQFIWGALQDEIPSLDFAQHCALSSVATELSKMLGRLGLLQAFYTSILAQLLEAAGQPLQAAHAYQALAQSQEPEVKWWLPFFAKKAARLYVQLNEERLAEVILGKCSEDVEAQHELLKLLAKRGAPEAASLAKQLAASSQEEDWTIEMRLLLINRQRSSLEHAVKMAAEWPSFPHLGTASQEGWTHALSFQLQAEEDAKDRGWHLGQAALHFSKVVEVELRERIFVPFRNQVAGTKESLEDEKLDRFIRREGALTLGEMVHCLLKDERLKSYLGTHCRQLLSPRVQTLLKQLNRIGRSARHEFGPQSATQAREVAQQVIEAMDDAMKR